MATFSLLARRDEKRRETKRRDETRRDELDWIRVEWNWMSWAEMRRKSSLCATKTRFSLCACSLLYRAGSNILTLPSLSLSLFSSSASSSPLSRLHPLLNYCMSFSNIRISNIRANRNFSTWDSSLFLFLGFTKALISLLLSCLFLSCRTQTGLTKLYFYFTFLFEPIFFLFESKQKVYRDSQLYKSTFSSVQFS